MKKIINYMGLSELMGMIVIFVTFCLNNKKIIIIITLNVNG